jgi:F-type H+-transporting ATPase subunit b
MGNIEEVMGDVASAVSESLGPLGNGFVFTTANIMEIVIQLAATILLFVIVRFFFWKPLTKILENRKELIDKSLLEADAARENAKAIEAELQSELTKSKMEIKELLSKAEKDANVRREQIINDAKEEAKRRLDNLETELTLEKSKMEKDIRKEIVDIAFAAAEKIVAREIDHKKYLDVVDDILKEAME